MSKFEVVSKYTDAGLNLPKRSTGFAAGYDFEVAKDITIPSYFTQIDTLRLLHSGSIGLDEMAKYTKQVGAKPTLVPTGIKCQIDTGWYLKLVVRSSLPLKHWLILANGEGIIDGDYYNNPDNEGEIFFQLINLSPFPIELHKGDRIGQGVFVPYGLVDGDKYGEGEKRKGGFGSTSIPNNTIWVMDKLINDIEDVKPIEPKYITTTNVSTELPYEYAQYNQLTLDDWEKMKDSLV